MANKENLDNSMCYVVAPKKKGRIIVTILSLCLLSIPMFFLVITNDLFLVVLCSILISFLVLIVVVNIWGIICCKLIAYKRVFVRQGYITKRKFTFNEIKKVEIVMEHRGRNGGWVKLNRIYLKNNRKIDIDARDINVDRLLNEFRKNDIPVYDLGLKI